MWIEGAARQAGAPRRRCERRPRRGRRGRPDPPVAPAALHPGGARSLPPAGAKETARVPVTLGPAKAHPWLRTRNACEEGATRATTGPGRGACSVGARIPWRASTPRRVTWWGNLSNRVFAWLPGHPTAATWQPLGGPPGPGGERPPAPAPPAPLRLDGFGVGAFDDVPAYPRGPLQVAAGPRSEHLWLRALPSQISASGPPGRSSAPAIASMSRWRSCAAGCPSSSTCGPEAGGSPPTATWPPAAPTATPVDLPRHARTASWPCGPTPTPAAPRAPTTSGCSGGARTHGPRRA